MIVSKHWSSYLYWTNWNKTGELFLSAFREDPKEIHILNQKFNRLRSVHHQAGVNSSLWSPVEDVFATAGWDGYVRLWNIDGQLLYEKRLSAESVESATWSVDGKHIFASTSDGFLYKISRSDLIDDKIMSAEKKLFFCQTDQEVRYAVVTGMEGIFKVDFERNVSELIYGRSYGMSIAKDSNKNMFLVTTGCGELCAIEDGAIDVILKYEAEGRGVAVNNESMVAVGFADGSVYIGISVDKLEKTRQLEQEVVALCFHPFERTLFIGTQGGSAFIECMERKKQL